MRENPQSLAPLRDKVPGVDDAVGDGIAGSSKTLTESAIGLAFLGGFVAFDVFDEDPFRLDRFDDVTEREGEVAAVASAAAASGDRMRLTRQARSEDVDFVMVNTPVSFGIGDVAEVSNVGKFPGKNGGGEGVDFGNRDEPAVDSSQFIRGLIAAHAGAKT